MTSYTYSSSSSGRQQPRIDTRPLPPLPPSFPSPIISTSQAQTPDWTQYAEAANAHLDTYESYDYPEYQSSYTSNPYPQAQSQQRTTNWNEPVNGTGRYYGYGSDYGNDYRNEYEHDDARTPGAGTAPALRNGRSNSSQRSDTQDYFSNPYSPSSSPLSTNIYHMHEGQSTNGSSQAHYNIGPSVDLTHLDNINSKFPNDDYTPGAPIYRSVSDSSAMMSSYDPNLASFAFPQPDMRRAISQSSEVSNLHRDSSVSSHYSRYSLNDPDEITPEQYQRHSLSDTRLATSLSRHSSYSSYAPSLNQVFQDDDLTELTEELSHMTLESEEGLRRFQAGELNPADEEWHKLVPETAREALGKREVQRQSILFELFKAERDYVADLEAVVDVIISPLHQGNILGDKTEDFVHNVFWNITDVLTFHQKMLASLFSRQRDQHPLIQSVSDIILETAFQFQPAYEEYIKHYPLSEARHRSEMIRNKGYKTFLEGAAKDPRIKKRDLVTFISRPVTRLPRLLLVLDNILEHTDEGHPDLETIPLIKNILSDFLKSTQPGIDAANSKVKFWGVIENLVFKKEEIIDLDVQDAGRSLVYSRELARRQRSADDWHGWNDYFVVLLDHYLLLTREHKRPNVSKYEVASRPIPLEFLRLGQFDQPPEYRREKSEEGGILDSLRSKTREQYPFTIYHAANKTTRRYTLYTNTEAGRRKWLEMFNDAILIHKVRQDANQWFAPSIINDGVFRIRSTLVSQTSSELLTGNILSGDTFVSGGRSYVVVGTEGGVYVCARGDINFRRVLPFGNAIYIVALQEHNKVVVLASGILLSYSMDIMARVSQGTSTTEALDASKEKISGDDTVSIAKAGILRGRTVVVYTVKTFRQTNVVTMEASNEPSASRLRQKKTLSYKPFGSPFYVPRTAYEITLLSKTIAIAGEKGLTINDPKDPSVLSVAPDFADASKDPAVASLKDRCEHSKLLGLVRVSRVESMVIFEDFGCYVNRHGFPSRNAAIVHWECKIARFVERITHVLLFSGGTISGPNVEVEAQFIEVRQKNTGRLVQVIEGDDLRLLNPGIVDPGLQFNSLGNGDSLRVSEKVQQELDVVPLLVTRRGKKNDEHGQSVELLELVKTSAYPSSTPSTSTSYGDVKEYPWA